VKRKIKHSVSTKQSASGMLGSRIRIFSLLADKKLIEQSLINLMQMHKGSIHVESQEGRQTTFTLAF
jgi:hypothetical protein